MKIVIDTNILWVSIPRSSPSNWIVRDLLKNKFSLCVTTDILGEYEEIINRFLGVETTNNFMEFLETLPNVEYITNIFVGNSSRMTQRMINLQIAICGEMQSIW